MVRWFKVVLPGLAGGVGRDIAANVAAIEASSALLPPGLAPGNYTMLRSRNDSFANGEQNSVFGVSILSGYITVHS